MKQDMIVILVLGSTENTVVARAIRDMGVYSEIHPHDITVEELKALDNVKGIILNGGENRVVAVRSVLRFSPAETAAQEMVYAPASASAAGVTPTVIVWLLRGSMEILLTGLLSPEGVKVTLQPAGALDEKL